MPRNAQKVRVEFQLSPRMYAALEKRAKEEDRPVANLLVRLVGDVLGRAPQEEWQLPVGGKEVVPTPAKPPAEPDWSTMSADERYRWAEKN